MSERDVQDSLKFMREKLRKERKAQNMSQLTLSAEADLACNTICRIEKGTAEPGIGNLLRLTDALHMEEMVEVRKEVSDMPCGNAIPAEDAGHQTEKDVAGRESDRVPAPEMNPKVQLELLSGEGRKKAIGAVVIYNAVTIRGISVVENSKKNPFVKMPRAPKGARTKHSDIAYPINRAAREMLYSAVLQEYDRLRSEEELRRQETKLQVS